ncbi:hypothetical protein KDA08_02830 [Candidatus Saccharibacteria bacterium]|nr:hypothetical protein [Candidatus Saccharibacteria bacterium]
MDIVKILFALVIILTTGSGGSYLLYNGIKDRDEDVIVYGVLALMIAVGTIFYTANIA